MKNKTLLFLLVLMLIAIGFLSLSFGTIWISPLNVAHALLSHNSEHFITIVSFRLPRVLIALFAGGLLALSGLLLQVALKNELASPDVIGLNKASALAIVLINFFILYPSKPLLVISALIGALASSYLLFLIARRFFFSQKTIILTGVALSFAFDAAIKLFTFSQKQLLVKQMTWLVGSLWGRYWEMIPILVLTTIFLGIFLYMTHQKFFLLQLDTGLLPTLGIKSATLTWTYVLISSLVTGITVSTVGAIGFIGLLAPHITKRITPIYTPFRFALTFIIGSLILTLADLIGRSMISPLEIPAGIIVSLIGGPYFLFLLFSKKAGAYNR